MHVRKVSDLIKNNKLDLIATGKNTAACTIFIQMLWYHVCEYHHISFPLS